MSDDLPPCAQAVKGVQGPTGVPVRLQVDMICERRVFSVEQVHAVPPLGIRHPLDRAERFVVTHCPQRPECGQQVVGER